MTGTSTERGKTLKSLSWSQEMYVISGYNYNRLAKKAPKPLQPIMKTVVPHNPPDFHRINKERAEVLSFDADTLEV